MRSLLQTGQSAADSSLLRFRVRDNFSDGSGSGSYPPNNGGDYQAGHEEPDHMHRQLCKRIVGREPVPVP